MCRNLPHDGTAKANNGKHVRLLGRKWVGVATNVYSRKMLETTKKRYANFEMKGSGVVYA